MSFHCKSRHTGPGTIFASLGLSLVLINLWPLFTKRNIIFVNCSREVGVTIGQLKDYKDEVKEEIKITNITQPHNIKEKEKGISNEN